MLQCTCNHSATLPHPGRGMIPMISESRLALKTDSLFSAVTSTLITQIITVEALDPTIRLCEVGYRICRGVLQTFARVSGVSPFGLPPRQLRRAERHFSRLCLSRPSVPSRPDAQSKNQAYSRGRLGPAIFSREESSMFHNRLTRSADFLVRFILVAALIATLTLTAPLVPAAHAASIPVTTCNASDLINAINTANSNGESDTITLTAGCTYLSLRPTITGMALPACPRLPASLLLTVMGPPLHAIPFFLLPPVLCRRDQCLHRRP